MATFGITTSGSGLRSAEGPDAVETGLARRLAGLAPGAPIVILIHGYRFHQAEAHGTLFAVEPPGGDPRVRSWPAGLGFAEDDGASGLCIGFGWPARASHLDSLVRQGRTGFAEVYDRAGELAGELAHLIALVQRLAPARPVDLLAHSLGARLALAALPRLARAPDRVILLGAAELDARVHEVLDALHAPVPPQIYNVTARANDLYDLVFEAFVPRRHWGERAIGVGLRDAPACWLDVELDRADVTDWINARGIALSRPTGWPCHWGFYTRDGALAVYRAILRRSAGWDIPSLRMAACFARRPSRRKRVLPAGGWAPPPSGALGA